MAALPNPSRPTVICRADAKAAGLKRYFTGEPCKRGHVAERGVNHKHCVECLVEDSAEYYAKNSAIHMARTVRWRRQNPESTAQTYRRWVNSNRDVVRANNQKRRALRSEAEGTHSANDVLRIFSLQRGRCGYCRTSIRAGYHVDHIKPLSKGGSNWPRNIQLLCATCNVRKHAHDPIIFAQREGMLL